MEERAAKVGLPPNTLHYLYPWGGGGAGIGGPRIKPGDTQNVSQVPMPAITRSLSRLRARPPQQLLLSLRLRLRCCDYMYRSAQSTRSMHSGWGQG
jgi:hypothetical protein